jgi:murein tripeptide amidase MpaA
MPYRTAAQLESILSSLAGELPQLCTRVQLATPSIQGRTLHALRLAAGGGAGRRGVLIVGGIHARELMNPDAIVELLRDMLLAYIFGRGITYGGRSWSAVDVRLMIETLDIWMIPCANPDGRQRVMDGDDLWRKNVRDNPGTACEGVDLNRNFDIAWGTTTTATSCNPCDSSQTYCGSAAFSEPEAKNVRDFCASHRIDVFVDVHSFSELVLYPWGHALTQTTDPAQNFTTLASGTCLPLNPPTYKEHMRPYDLLRVQTVSQRIVDSVRAVRGRTYTPEPSHSVYATGASGTSSDWVYSRHLANPGLHKTYAFALETGPRTGNNAEDFHPSNETTLSLIKRDAKAAMLTLIQQSVCAIDFIGTTLLGRVAAVDSVRSLRDDKLATTDAGLAWIDVLERVQVRLLGEILSDESLRQEAVGLFERAAALADKSSAKLTSRDVDRAQAFLHALVERVPDADVKRDISQIANQLARSTGQTAQQIVETLMRQRPGGRQRT